MQLTKAFIDEATYQGDGKSRDIRWDHEITGLGLRVFPSGVKAFVLSFRCKGVKRLMTLGQAKVLTLTEARRLAKVHLGQVAQNVDPLENRKRALRGEDVESLCLDFLERHSKMHKRSWREDERRILKRIIPRIGRMLAKNVKHADIVRLHHDLGKASIYEANRSITLLGTIFEKGRDWGVIEPMAPNPARGVEKFRERTRDRWLTPEEMPRLAAAIREEHNLYAQAAIWLYLLTGVRKSELLRLQWTDVDFTRRELRLVDTKAGNTHYIPLSDAAIGHLRNIPRQSDNPFVVCGNRRGRALVNISKPWNRIRKRAQIEDVRLHDLRRTTGSWLAQSGHSLHLIGKVLNHADSDTTKIYARFGQSDVRNALELHGKAVVAAAESSVTNLEFNSKSSETEIA